MTVTDEQLKKILNFPNGTIRMLHRQSKIRNGEALLIISIFESAISCARSVSHVKSKTYERIEARNFLFGETYSSTMRKNFLHLIGVDPVFFDEMCKREMDMYDRWCDIHYKKKK